MSLFNKENEVTKITPAGRQEELNKELVDKREAGQHAVAHIFWKDEGKNLYREWEIFESRYNAVLNLKEGASKVEVKKAIARVKRASMDMRDALKKLGRFSV